MEDDIDTADFVLRDAKNELLNMATKYNLIDNWSGNKYYQMMHFALRDTNNRITKHGNLI